MANVIYAYKENGVMKINRRHFSVAGSALLLAGLKPAIAQSDNKIILGQSAAFTGPASELGIEFQRGAKMCFDQVNAQGGVVGRKIELRHLDDGYEPARCAANTRQFIDEDVFALFGYVGTPTSLLALPMATQARIPFIAPFTGAMGLRVPFNRYVFHLRASYNDETAQIVRQLTSLGLKRIAVFYQNDAYGMGGLNGVKLALFERGLSPVATATVERNSVEVDKAVKIMLAASPDAVVQIGAYKACAAFIRAARMAGFGGGFYNVSFVGTQALAEELGKEGLGVMVSQVMPSPYNPVRPITREFLAAVKLAGNKISPNYSSMEGYLAARVFIEGLKRAAALGGKLSRDSLISGLEAIDNQLFGGFMVSFSPTNHVASQFVELSMLTGDSRWVRT
jgi:ABC-type branched-subunit amino acid transport system substrate-binding protein